VSFNKFRHSQRSLLWLFASVLGLSVSSLVRAQTGLNVNIDFEDRSGPDRVSLSQDVKYPSVTFSGGQLTHKTMQINSFGVDGPLQNQSGVYGMVIYDLSGSLRCPTCGGGPMKLTFPMSVSNLSFDITGTTAPGGGLSPPYTAPLQGCTYHDDVNPTIQSLYSVITDSTNVVPSGHVEIPDRGIKEFDLVCVEGNIPFLSAYLDNVHFTVDADLSDPIDSKLVSLDSKGNPVLSSDTDQLATASRQVNGAAADGVTQLLIRIAAVNVGDQFTLQLVNENNQSDTIAANGGLYAVGSPSSLLSSSLTVKAVDTTAGPMAFAWYAAPLDFYRGIVDDSALSRKLSINIDLAGPPPLHTLLPLTLVRPPVFLVHGLWGEPSDWDTFTDITRNPWIYPHAADYFATNSQGIAINAPIVLSQLRNWVHNYAAGLSIAAVQADLVGHSMGGLVSRYLPLSYCTVPTSCFTNMNNYNQGPVHKLITIGTPHLGTPLSTELQKPQNIYSQLILNTQGFHIFDGAVADLEGTGDGNPPPGGGPPYSAVISDIMKSTRPFPIAFLGGESTAANWPDPTGVQHSPLSKAVLVPAALISACTALDVTDPIPLKHCDDTIISNLTQTGWPSLFANKPNDSLVPVLSQFSGNITAVGVINMLHDGGIQALGFSAPIELGSPNAFGQQTLDLLNAHTDDPGFTPAGKN
jgi:pimeloyl-ACP methyl ester carboxylesterase